MWLVSPLRAFKIPATVFYSIAGNETKTNTAKGKRIVFCSVEKEKWGSQKGLACATIHLSLPFDTYILSKKYNFIN